MYYIARGVSLAKRRICHSNASMNKTVLPDFFSISICLYFLSFNLDAFHAHVPHTDFSSSAIFFHVTEFYSNGNDKVGSTKRVSLISFWMRIPQKLDCTCLTHTHAHIHSIEHAGSRDMLLKCWLINAT